MRINFYDTRISDDDRTILVKEKGVNYQEGKMNNPQVIAEMMQKLLHMDTLAEEYCYMIALNSANKPLGLFFISKGTVSASLVSPRELFIRALLAGAVSVVLCHNHPSGNVLPSDADLKLTNQIKEAGKLIGIGLLDHIIISGSGYFSFRESDLLKKDGDAV